MWPSMRGRDFHRQQGARSVCSRQERCTWHDMTRARSIQIDKFSIRSVKHRSGNLREERERGDPSSARCFKMKDTRHCLKMCTVWRSCFRTGKECRAGPDDEGRKQEIWTWGKDGGGGVDGDEWTAGLQWRCVCDIWVRVIILACA